MTFVPYSPFVMAIEERRFFYAKVDEFLRVLKLLHEVSSEASDLWSGGCSLMVEHLIVNEKVGGSNPLSHPKKLEYL